MKLCSYQSAVDLQRSQAALMQWVRQAGHCNYLHKGDIGHRLFNTCYGYDPSDMFRYWLDEGGEIAAFAVFCPHWEFFDLQVAPGLLCGDRHIAIFAYCERETLMLGEKYDKKIKELGVEVCDCDPVYKAFVKARGYSYSKLLFTLTRHDLAQMPAAPLPDGFRFHDATAADAAALADVHNHSFTNKWNADSYGEVFRSPHMERELVVVAPDGRFAAFTNLWIDEVNRSLLFEPVGTHSDYRRRGIAKALMVYALKRMTAERDIQYAYGGHEPPDKNPASGALYASVGFQVLHTIREFSKTCSGDPAS